MPRSKIVKEGGYQPTSDAGPFPAALIREEEAGHVEEPAAPPDDARVAAVELRRKMLRILSEREASPEELARELREPLATVAHHVRFLLKWGWIELVRQEQRRGAIVHYYRARVEALPRLLEMVGSRSAAGLQDSLAD